MAINHESCWQIVDLTRAACGGDIHRQAELIVAQLRTRPTDEIVKFGSWVRQRMDDASLPYVFLAAEWIYAAHDMHPVSGDTWEYFRGWLVAQGRRIYEDVLSDPDVLGDLFDKIENFGWGECVEYAANHAWSAASGGQRDEEPPYQFRLPEGLDYPDELFEPCLIDSFPGRPAGEELTPERLQTRFPRIFKRFGPPRFEV